MSKVKLGTKHECVSCGAKFYDLGKAQAICPSCGADQQNPDAAGEPEVVRRHRNVEIEDSTFIDPDEEVGGNLDIEEDSFAGDLEDDDDIEEIEE